MNVFAVVVIAASVVAMVAHSVIVVRQKKVFIFAQKVYLREWILGMICWVGLIALMLWSLYGPAPSQEFRIVVTYAGGLVIAAIGSLMIWDDWNEYRRRVQKHRDGAKRLMCFFSGN